MRRAARLLFVSFAMFCVAGKCMCEPLLFLFCIDDARGLLALYPVPVTVFPKRTCSLPPS